MLSIHHLKSMQSPSLSQFPTVYYTVLGFLVKAMGIVDAIVLFSTFNEIKYREESPMHL